jgi:murein DD-endopeptidase MepM/ murein hydrolase activator NlpD
MEERRRRLIAATAAIFFSGGLLLKAAEGKTHTVRKGDTLSAIGLKYGVSVGALKRANGLSSDLIRVGQTLRIPEGTTVDVGRLLKGIPVDTRRWTHIVAHHSATPHGNAEVYDRNHRRRGMENGLAYHFVIGNGRDSGDGEIEIGPRWRGQLEGGHVRRREINLHGIGICLVGNFEETRPTARQMASFTALVDHLGRDLLRSKFTFAVHREIDRNHTVCPGKYFPIKAMHARYG